MRRRDLLIATSVVVVAGCAIDDDVFLEVSASPELIARTRMLGITWVRGGESRPWRVERLDVPGDLGLPGLVRGRAPRSTPHWLLVRAYDSTSDAARTIADAILLVPAQRDPRFVHSIRLTPSEETTDDHPTLQGV